jgi:trigger factor
MKIEVEKEPPGMATLRIELPPEDVRKEWDAIASNYSRYARIPGYRAGSAAPGHREEVSQRDPDELTKALVSKSYHEAIAEKQLRVVSLTDVGDVEFGEDRSMRFRATVVTAPEFELPDYKNITVQLPATAVTEAELDIAIERLRDQAADFVDVKDRELAMGDFAVLDFAGAIDGVPISEIVPEPSLHGGRVLAPSRAGEFPAEVLRQIVGIEKGDTRSVQESPAEFPVTELAGKRPLCR